MFAVSVRVLLAVFKNGAGKGFPSSRRRVISIQHIEVLLKKWKIVHRECSLSDRLQCNFITLHITNFTFFYK